MMTSTRPSWRSSWLVAFFAAMALISSASASISTRNTSLSIYEASDKYKYIGCWNETTEIPGAGGARALSGGKSEMLMGNMTVPLCLSYCMSDGDSYKYVGLQYSRECWCSHYISSLSVKLNDSACNDPCDGNQNVACGGDLKLTVYQLQSSAAARVSVTRAGVVLGALMMLFGSLLQSLT